MTETLTDIASLVDSAFDEVQCESVRKEIPHEGNLAAILVAHSCATTALCQRHLRRYLEVKRPNLQQKLDGAGCIRCAHCGDRFASVEAFQKVYVL